MLSCKKATLLVEKRRGDSLSFAEKIQLNMHLKICDKCASYKKQSLFIDDVIKNNKDVIFPKGTLSNTSKEKMQGLIDESLNNN